MLNLDIEKIYIERLKLIREFVERKIRHFIDYFAYKSEY